MPKPAFKLEDLFGGATNIAADPNDPNTPGPIDPNSPPPDGGDPNLPLPDINNPDYPNPLPPLDMPFPTEQGPDAPPDSGPQGGPAAPPSGPIPDQPAPLIPAASPTSATTPGSFADPGSSAARPLQPFNYRSLFDPRNQTQGSLVPGSRVPTTPANIAPEAGILGGQSESAITRALRRLRG